jgi:2'-5' RNA ligase
MMPYDGGEKHPVSSPPGKKTHLTSCVIVPPEEVWDPIQRVRRLHDPHVRRWIPHINLLYPFVPHARLDEAARDIADAASIHAPFDLELTEFGFFVHRKGRITLWLEPRPVLPLERLHSDLLERFPHCDDTARHQGGFTPHLSLGVFLRRNEARIVRDELESGWDPIRFHVGHVQIIARSGFEKDPFEVVARLPLGKALGGRST